MKSQKEIIKHLSDKDLLLNLYASQLFMLLLAFFASKLLLGSWFAPLSMISFSSEAIVIGFLIAIGVVVVELVFVRILPKRFFDDGGINERVFKKRSVVHILILSLTVAICEEILFRGVIQTSFGIVIASIIFALIHIRYLTHPFLFGFTIILSFLLGYVYLVTGNLLTVIAAHFFIDAILGVFIRFNVLEKLGKNP
ncbi:CPBP family intramembrane glutamic endopeptidase [Alteribacter aurantiacus]|uniref:CPBP family intramembrane glutamic endopeptidase n=1 Tax=Alteribacter aurantiacus TaxID=254410 RepID=UPI000410FBB0|nr:type II CAAX endopeptidase family protein [Alteribacter aurantiacus]